MINTIHAVVTVVMTVAICATGCVGAQNSSWQKEFGISERTLVPTGRNQYFILEPGFQIVLEGKTGLFGKNYEKVAITVLDETKEVNGILTRIVEEREWKNGKLIEVSRNFFAICQSTKDVFYFGEDVDMYKGKKVSSHKGAWLAGKNDAKAGLMMPGEPSVGMKYFQEIASGVAMDRAEIVNLDHKLETPAGSFSKCLKTKEGTALNFIEKEFKSYAPGIGLIQDGKLLLTKYGFIDKK
jgi:hypothetical protein